LISCSVVSVVTTSSEWPLATPRYAHPLVVPQFVHL
jgi:hypothetical protein